MHTRLFLAALLFACSALSACNMMAESDWKKATIANTIADYETFLQEHPDNKHADNARGRILALRDEQAWRAAQAGNTIVDYEGYLKAQSGGVHVGEAKYQITALQRADAWKTIQSDPSAAALKAFLVIYPQGRESNEARAKLNEFYRLQLGEAPSAAAAERKRAQLASRFGKELSNIVVVAPKTSGAAFQVVSGPMSQSAANAACATLERAHQTCKSIQGAGGDAPPASLSAN